MPESLGRVLVVDDEADLGELLAWRLRRRGYQVDLMADGRGVMEKAASHDYSLFLLDVMLPGIKGLEICKLLREDWRSRRAGILVCSALGEGLSREEVLRAGADDYLTKPLDLEAFERRVDLLASRGGKAAAQVFFPRLGLDLDASRLELDGRILDLKPVELLVLKALIALPEGQWVPLDRLASLLWCLGSLQTAEALVRSLASLAAKASQPGADRPAVVEYSPERGARFNPR
jgi:DNA-binding response OmpR family regulator